jgi:hypothetical protein
LLCCIMFLMVASTLFACCGAGAQSMFLQENLPYSSSGPTPAIMLNLAGQTSKATEEIGAQVNLIQDSTRQVVAAIRDICRTIEEVSAIANAIASVVE